MIKGGRYIKIKSLKWRVSLLQEYGKNKDQLNGHKESESGDNIHVGLGTVYHFLLLLQ